MTFLNVFLGRAFDLLLAPFGQLPPVVGLTAVSLLTAVPMLLVFRAVSDQAQLAAVKRAIVGGLFEIRLFNDDLPAIFRAQGEILRQNARYLRLSLVPMLWLIVPLVLTVAQLEYHFGYTGPAPGEPVLLTATLRHRIDMAVVDPSDGESAAAPQAPAQLEAPGAVQVLTPAVWFPAADEVLWRIQADSPGDYQLRIRVGDEVVAKTLRVDRGIGRRSPARLAPSFTNEVLFPAEAPLPAGSALTRVSVAYDSRAIRMLGWNVPWMVAYFGLTILIAVLLRKPLGVTM